MSKRVIRMSLNATDIDRAIKEIKQYKADFQKKVDTYRNRIAEEIAVQASINFGSSVLDDVINGSPRRPQVDVTVSEKGDIT